MASQQLKRDNKLNEEIKNQVGEDPKVTSHSESYSSADQPPGVVKHQVVETIEGTAPDQGGMQGTTLQAGQQQKGTTATAQTKKEGDQYKGPSLEEISKLRGTAQQRSNEAIRAAEEKSYQKTVGQGPQQTTTRTIDRSRAQGYPSGQTRDLADTAMDVGKKGADIVGRTAVAGGDIALETGRTAAEYAGKAAVAGTDVALETGRAAAEAAGKAAGVMKDVGVVAGWNAAELARDTATGVTETLEGAVDVVAETTGEFVGSAVDVSKKGAGFVADAAVTGKDVAVETGKAALETGKAAVGYIGKAAGVLEDVAMVAGWKAAELASGTATGIQENLEEASEEAQNVTGRVIDTTVDVTRKGASYAGETAVAGKDVTLKTGRTAAEYAGKAAGVAKDVGVVAGWKATELTSDAAVGVTENIEDLSGQAEDTVGEIIDRVAGATEKGASYLGETVVAGKDMALETGKATARYAGKAAGMATEVAKDAAVGLVETTADVGQKGARFVGDTVVAGTDIALETGKATVGYAGKAAGMATGVAKDAAVGLVDVGQKGARLVGDTVVAGTGIALETGKATAGYAGKAAGLATDAAAGLVETTADVGQKGARYLGDAVVAGTDIALETGKATAGYAGKAAGAAADVAKSAGYNATKLAGDAAGATKDVLASAAPEMGRQSEAKNYGEFKKQVQGSCQSCGNRMTERDYARQGDTKSQGAGAVIVEKCIECRGSGAAVQAEVGVDNKGDATGVTRVTEKRWHS